MASNIMYDGTKLPSFKHGIDDPEGIQSMNLCPYHRNCSVKYKSTHEWYIWHKFSLSNLNEIQKTNKV